ncbi:MAG: (5-formylfuran-3-yl)methyl phosphate synthase [Acidobacteriota bacterium]
MIDLAQMRLLVSVTSAAEAAAALSGGADVIDAKDPRRGALGAVSPETLRAIHAVVDPGRLVTAALGDARDDATIEQDARVFTAAGAALIKVGFAGISDAQRIGGLIAAAVRGATAGGGGVVAVAYADAAGAASLAPGALINVAARTGAAGLLVDTAEKGGPGLRALVPQRELAAWVAEARAGGLFVALAGQLTAGDLPFVHAAGAAIAGVRGAACDGGRTGRVSAERVRRLRAICEELNGGKL